MDKSNNTIQAPTDYKEKRIRAVCVETTASSLTPTEMDVMPRVTNDGESNSISYPSRAIFPIITDSAYITSFTDSE